MANKLKDYRKKLGLTQDELSSKSGVSRQTIIALENGTSRAASTKTLDKIAQALGTTVDVIFFTPTV